MGQHDSSLTRVAPVFDQLLRMDRAGASWLARLLRLGHRADLSALPADLGTLQADGPGAWGRNERALPPPLSLLGWLVQNVTEEAVKASGDRGETLVKRTKLARRDSETTAEALERLRAGERGRRWFVFEGHSYPDAVLETDKALVVVEGKRTERTTTTKTKWMSSRSQLLRHMDAAWEIADGRVVLGLLLVEGADPQPSEVPEKWRAASERDCVAESLRASLPHRSPEVRTEIARGLLGVATWQRVCETFELSWPPVHEPD